MIMKNLLNKIFDKIYVINLKQEVEKKYNWEKIKRIKYRIYYVGSNWWEKIKKLKLLIMVL